MNNILKDIKNIIFDFDGVIINSMDLRVDGVSKVFAHYDKQLVDKFISYYRYNAGLSKFIKIKYFYNEILGKDISEEKINDYSNQLSRIMREKLSTKEVLIEDTYKFIKNNYKRFNFHIASGSEQSELIFLCDRLEISKYFKCINGAPLHKNNLVQNIIEKNNYKKHETIIIGDSINDFESAKINEIGFVGYNNLELQKMGLGYMYKFN